MPGIAPRRKGASFEALVAAHLREYYPSAERHLTGSGQGDIGGLPLPLVIECKNCATFTPAAWFTQLAAAMQRTGAAMGVVIHKRRGVADPGRQFVTMDLNTFIDLLRREQWSSSP